MCRAAPYPMLAAATYLRDRCRLAVWFQPVWSVRLARCPRGVRCFLFPHPLSMN